MSRIFAVLTGDLVGSTNLRIETLERARATVIDAVAEIGRWQPDIVLGDAEFFRGDSWQVLLGEPRFFLRAALFVRAALRRERRELDSRIGVGLGTVDRIDRQRISLSIGDAFTRSGRQLDTMSNNIGITVALPPDQERRLGWLRPIVSLCSVSMNHWSERQSDIAARMLVPEGARQIDVAVTLEISRQMVSKTLTAIDFATILSVLRWVEEEGWEITADPRRHESTGLG